MSPHAATIHTDADLWHAYQADPTNDYTVERLIVHYSPLVKWVAGRIGPRLPDHVSNDEVLQAGMIGLYTAVKKFDPTRGLKFETYAVHRIEGTILDELRALDHLARNHRKEIKTLETAAQHLEHTLHRRPTNDEIADHLGQPVAQVTKIREAATYTRLASLDDVLTDAAQTDRHASSPHEAAEHADSIKTLAKAIASLRDRDRQIIALYYYDGFTYNQIAQVFAVTESRISQLLKTAHTNLAAAMAKLATTE